MKPSSDEAAEVPETEDNDLLGPTRAAEVHRPILKKIEYRVQNYVCTGTIPYHESDPRFALSAKPLLLYLQSVHNE